MQFAIVLRTVQEEHMDGDVHAAQVHAAVIVTTLVRDHDDGLGLGTRILGESLGNRAGHVLEVAGVTWVHVTDITQVPHLPVREQEDARDLAILLHQVGGADLGDRGDVVAHASGLVDDQGHRGQRLLDHGLDALHRGLGHAVARRNAELLTDGQRMHVRTLQAFVAPVARTHLADVAGPLVVRAQLILVREDQQLEVHGQLTRERKQLVELRDRMHGLALSVTGAARHLGHRRDRHGWLELDALIRQRVDQLFLELGFGAATDEGCDQQAQEGHGVQGGRNAHGILPFALGGWGLGEKDNEHNRLA